MNKKNMLLTMLFAISAAPIFSAEADQPSRPEKNQYEWNGALCKTIASIISGGLIGTVTGKLSSVACGITIKTAAISLAIINEKNKETAVFLPVMTMTAIPAILIIENLLRTRLANRINESLEENTINHRKNLIHDTAWIASWIAFLV